MVTDRRLRQADHLRLHAFRVTDWTTPMTDLLGTPNIGTGVARAPRPCRLRCAARRAPARVSSTEMEAARPRRVLLRPRSERSLRLGRPAVVDRADASVRARVPRGARDRRRRAAVVLRELRGHPRRGRARPLLPRHVEPDEHDGPVRRRRPACSTPAASGSTACRRSSRACCATSLPDAEFVGVEDMMRELRARTSCPRRSRACAPQPRSRSRRCTPPSPRCGPASPSTISAPRSSSACATLGTSQFAQQGTFTVIDPGAPFRWTTSDRVLARRRCRSPSRAACCGRGTRAPSRARGGAETSAPRRRARPRVPGSRAGVR